MFYNCLFNYYDAICLFWGYSAIYRQNLGQIFLIPENKIFIVESISIETAHS